MGAVRVSFPHALAVWNRSLAQYRTTWKLSLLPNFFEPMLYLVAMGIGLGAYITEMGGTSYVAFLAPGLVAVAAMNGASHEVTYNAFVRLNFEKAYESMLTTPVQPEDLLVGEVLWATTRALIYGLSFFVVVAAFGLAPMPGALLAIPLVPLTGFLFAAIGIVFSLQIPRILFSDIFFPIDERLSGVWLSVAEGLPLLHPVRLMRAAFGGEVSWILLWDLAYIAVLSGLLMVVAARITRRRLAS
jgi:lipooligosaccharide transport system permease protein